MESVTPATPALKRWSIRRYYTYMDEYYVEAPSLTEADQRLEEVLNTEGIIRDDENRGVLQVAHNEYVDYDSTQGNEIDEHGMWLTEPEEL